jgi:hypothetical protein
MKFERHNCGDVQDCRQIYVFSDDINEQQIGPTTPCSCPYTDALMVAYTTKKVGHQILYFQLAVTTILVDRVFFILAKIDW